MIASYAAAPSNHSQVQLIVTHTYRVRVLNTEGTKHSYHKHVISHITTQVLQDITKGNITQTNTHIHTRTRTAHTQTHTLINIRGAATIASPG